MATAAETESRTAGPRRAELAAEIAISLAIWVLALLAPMSPRLLPFLYFALVATLLVADAVSGRPAEILLRRWGGLGWGIALALWGIASSLWSDDPGAAASSAALLLAVMITAPYAAASLVRRLDGLPDLRRNRFVRAVPLGAPFGLLYLLIDLHAGGVLTETVLNLVPGVVGDRGKGLAVGETIAVASDFFFNRSVATLVLLTPVTVAATVLWWRLKARSYVLMGAGFLLAATVAASESETAKLALPVMLGVAILAYRFPSATGQGLRLVTILAMLLAVPLSLAPATLGLDRTPHLPLSFRDRVRIWDFAARETLGSPIVGLGIQSARARQEELLRAGQSQAELQGRPGWHAHNFFLQIWYELGAVGAALALGFALSSLAAIGRLGPQIRAWGCGLYAGVLASSFGWGLWQEWFIGLLAALAALLAMLDAEYRIRAGLPAMRKPGSGS